MATGKFLDPKKQRKFQCAVAYPGFFGGEGISQEIFSVFQHIQLRIEGSENGDQGAVAP
jgi:hypothetical protein